MSLDKIVEPKRTPLIPGMEAVKSATLEAAHLGVLLVVFGPTAVLVIDDRKKHKGMFKSDASLLTEEGPADIVDEMLVLGKFFVEVRTIPRDDC
ncbi:hypothetical protein IFM89_018061 [Coptis chinensis]|uniref:Uncharacterized protein n=1 Tax=Coptis chinensis TaxID=261450 RepID=A0A835HWM7_9MAGN|nr:hypothetical protein IFM89_018061 [Coptis chinensis]